MKELILLSFLIIGGILFSQAPANDNCSSATVLTIDGGLSCTQTTDNSTLEGSECYTNYGGATEHTVWYRFTATNDSLVMSITKTNSTNCVSPHVRVFGPFGSGAGCIPSCATEVFNDLHDGDLGQHDLLTGLATTGDNEYLIQIQDIDCGGPNDRHVEFCIGVFNPAINNKPDGATLIDQCGTVINGTNIGYYPMNGAVGLEDLDNNAGTTCSSCTAGDDVSYIVNNDSWFTFCATSTGDWSVDFNGIANCTNPTTNDGLQMTIFRGTTSNLTEVWNAASPSEPGSSQTSSTFTVSSGECIYMIVDGFSGDQCDYSYTLNNLTTPCDLTSLPTELLGFVGFNIAGVNTLRWSTASEINSSHFELDRSSDGKNWHTLLKVPAAGNSQSQLSYVVKDNKFPKATNYYKLTQYDLDGTLVWTRELSIDNSLTAQVIVRTINLFGEEVGQDYRGIVIDVYENGSSTKRYQQ